MSLLKKIFSVGTTKLKARILELELKNVTLEEKLEQRQNAINRTNAYWKKVIQEMKHKQKPFKESKTKQV